MYCNVTNQEPELGELTGECCICGQITKHGYRKRFSGGLLRRIR